MARRFVWCEWGLDGARHLAQRCPTLIIVDVISFSTTIDVATARGAIVHPCAGRGAEAEALAERLGAELAGLRGSAARYSLSPASMAEIPAGTRLVLPSPNGSRIAASIAGASAVFAGCLRNAAAVARSASPLPGDIGVVAAGERWPGGSLRPAIEDWLGAGAILAALAERTLSAEALAAASAFRALADRLPETFAQSLSGQEIIAAGYPGDIALAALHNASEAAPRLGDGAFRAA